LAVLYDKLKAYQKSALEWRWCSEADTVKMGRPPSDKKNLISLPDAGYNAVLQMDQARLRVLKDVYHNDTAAAYKGPETRAYFDYVDWFSGAFGHYPSLAELAYNAAIIHYEARQYDAAVKSLSGLVEKFPDHPQVVLIRRVLAQSLLESGRYGDASRQFVILQNKLCPFDSQCAEIKKSMASIMFKEAETQQKSHDYAGAAQKYQQLVRDYREVEFADKALFEAGINADSSGHPEDGARLLSRIPQDFPKSVLRVKALLKAASIYMDAKKFRDAADVFLRLQRDFPNDSLGGIQAIAWAADAYQKAKDDRRAGKTFESAFRLYPGHPKTPEYVYNAGQIYENLKSYGDAIVVYRLIESNYPASQFTEDAMFSIPLLLDKQGDRENAARAYHNFAMMYAGDKAKAIQAFLSAGKDYELLGDEKQAIEEYGRCIALQSGSGIPPAMAAEAAYRIGDIYYRKVASTRLDGTKSQNDSRLKGMQENLIPSIQAFAKAVGMAEEEWALRATLRMGDLFSTIAIISDNQRVAGLSEEDRIRVNIEAKSSVPNYIDKAKELYKKNLDIGVSQKLQNPLIDTSGMRLMDAFALKGRALEDLARLFLNIPIPEGTDAEDIKAARLQLKQAADGQKAKAADNYREALNLAQTYHLDNPGISRIAARLRELAPDSTGTQSRVSSPIPPSAERPDTSEASKVQGK
jgi:TolA-binding protein